jgi:hypothetical protein
MASTSYITNCRISMCFTIYNCSFAHTLLVLFETSFLSVTLVKHVLIVHQMGLFQNHKFSIWEKKNGTSCVYFKLKKNSVKIWGKKNILSFDW